MEDKGYSHFWAKVNLDTVDDKLKRFIILRNELAMLAEELGCAVKQSLFEVNTKEPT